MLLLDTSVLVWAMLDLGRLGDRARARITAATAVHMSAVSIVELTIKSMLGKIDIPTNMRELALDEGYVELPITGLHGAAIRKFPELIRHDPFDRLLVAQAAVGGLDLLTADRVLLALDRPFILDATR